VDKGLLFLEKWCKSYHSLKGKKNEKFPYLDNEFLKVVDKTKLDPKKFYFAY
jgi:hypothetical protein